MGKRDQLVKLIATLMERDDKDVKSKELAQAIGVSEATISRFLDGENELSFGSIVKAVRFLVPENHFEVMAKVIPLIDQPASVRSVLEYYSVNRQLENLAQHIEMLSATTCRTNKDWAKMYAFSAKFQSRKHDNEDFLEELLDYSPKYPETKVFVKLLICRVYYQLRNFKMMFRVAKKVEKAVESLNNEYIRDCYTARLCEIYSQGYLYANGDVDKARFYANNVILSKIGATYEYYAYYTIGTSFMFESYEKALEHFNKYRELVSKDGREDLTSSIDKKDIPFLQNVWGKKPDNFDIIDETEKAHYYASVGESEKANEILNGNSETPFRTYYRGLANKDMRVMYEAMVKFISNGDKFYSNLAKRELSKSETFSFVANSLYDGMSIA